ncbi:MAG TPA: ATP-binding protein [Anaeromyxobacter sp.]|nr:ATP-binding protein [Anaeromyxobacter sp.]
MAAAALSLMAAALGAYVALLAHRFGHAPTFPDQGWFARVALSAAAFTLCNLVTTGQGAWPALVVTFARFQLLFAALNVAAWLHYASAHLQRPSRLDRPASIALVGAGLLLLVPGFGFTGRVVDTRFAPLELVYHNAELTPAGDLVLVALCAGILLVIARFLAARRRRVPHAGLHAGALAFLLAMAVNDSLVLAGVLRTPYLLDVGFIFPVAAVAYALGSRVVADARALAALRSELEGQVAERSRDLARSEAARVRAEKLAALGQLSAGVAHEVNNPAAILSANLSYLNEAVQARGALPADAQECLRESSQAVDRIARMVRQLLDASRLAAAAGDRPGEPVRLAAVASEAVRLSRLRTGRVPVLLEVPEGLWAQAQEQLVLQVLVNLIVNGAQAIPAEREGRVVVRGGRAGDRVRLLVEDDGAGMDVETLRRVFEPFFSTKPFGTGTGLGLAVSRGLVTSMGGDLRLESAQGVGTRAVVELPATEAPPVEPSRPVPAPQGPRRSVLLVDDDPAVRTALGRLLGDRFSIATAAGADEGIALARTDRFDVVLCDVMMPQGGAERLTAALEREAPAVAARIVFLTAGATTPSARAFLAGERRPVLLKPLDVGELERLAEQIAPEPRARA